MNYCLDVLENTNIKAVFDLREYEKYMLLDDAQIEPFISVECDEAVDMPKATDMPKEPKAVEIPKEPNAPTLCHVPVSKKSVIMPKYQNTLFWCFFIHHYGVAEYEMIGQRYQNAELDEKYRISETLEKEPGRLKATNYSPSKQTIKELCSAIASSTRDDFFSLIAFSAYYKTNTRVVFEHSRTYLEFNCGSDDNESKPMTIFATKSRMGAKWLYSLYTRDFDTTQYVKLNTYMKPLKGISAYKSDELIEMAEKMAIEIDKKDGKKELYEKIGQKIGSIHQE